MALAGIPIPETQCIGDSLDTINNAFQALDTAVAAAAGAGVTQIVAGSNISISPTGGTGVVTINGSASYTLPCRLGENSCTITNWNDAITNGWYMGSDATNAPGAGWYMGYVQAHNAGWTTQIIHQFAGNNSTWIREQNNSVWGSWTPYGAGSVNGIVQCDGNGNFSAATISGGVPVGYVGYYAATSAPTGWAECNGAAVTVALGSTYTDIRNFLIAQGSPFGASGSDPLLPDLRGKFIRSNGSDGTYSSAAFGTTQADDFESHNHTGTASYNAGDASTGGDAIPTTMVFQQARTFSLNINNRGGTETRPVNIALLACIKL